MTQRIALKVAARFMCADLSPPLGDPGGPCQVVQRIKEEVPNPLKQQSMIKEVLHGDDLSNQEAFEVYDADVESGNKLIRKFEIGAHAQYRMDLRAIKVNDLRQTFTAFAQRFEKLRSEHSPQYQEWSDGLLNHAEMEFTNPKTNLYVVFRTTGPGVVKVITTYWKGRPDPRVPSGGCPLPSS